GTRRRTGPGRWSETSGSRTDRPRPGKGAKTVPVVRGYALVFSRGVVWPGTPRGPALAKPLALLSIWLVPYFWNRRPSVPSTTKLEASNASVPGSGTLSAAAPPAHAVTAWIGSAVPPQSLFVAPLGHTATWASAHECALPV